MKIAILGGSFNPPHLGHVLIANEILKYKYADEVWLTPCYKHTFEKPLASVKHRVAMTKLLTNHKIKYCKEEIENKLSGQTIDLMRLLAKKYSREKFYFIVGSDNLASFKKWGNWYNLIINFDFLVFPRPEYKADLKKYGLDNPRFRFHLIKQQGLKTSSVSSTKVRESIKKKFNIHEFRSCHSERCEESLANANLKLVQRSFVAPLLRMTSKRETLDIENLVPFKIYSYLVKHKLYN